MLSQRSALQASVIIMAALGGPAWAAGGYAGINGSSTPVPTPTYRTFSGQPYRSVAPAYPSFNRYSATPYSPPPRPPIPAQPQK